MLPLQGRRSRVGGLQLASPLFTTMTFVLFLSLFLKKYLMENAENTISGPLAFTIFWGRMPPDPPYKLAPPALVSKPNLLQQRRRRPCAGSLRSLSSNNTLGWKHCQSINQNCHMKILTVKTVYSVCVV